MIKLLAVLGVVAGVWSAEISAATTPWAAIGQTNRLHIHAVEVRGQPVLWRASEAIHLAPYPEDIVFQFDSPLPTPHPPNRLRYRLEGYDSAWREDSGEMYLAIRFLDQANDQVGLQIFTARGDSAGWKGTLQTGTLTHRRETVVVPPRARRFHILISSAGPPATIGILVVDDLVVSRFSPAEESSSVLLRSPFAQKGKYPEGGQAPDGWIRDGVLPSMAKVVQFGCDPAINALAIVDEDGTGHAEWRNLRPVPIPMASGDQVVLEWNELFSIGLSDVRNARYRSLPAGDYQFRVAAATALGVPTGAEAVLAVHVALPFWRTPWFYGAVAALLMALALATGRYIAWHRMRQEMQRLQQQRLLEQERLRIAQNIHDDLGARVTQISLLSGMAQGNEEFPEKARADFDRISCMARDLVTALYETVWAVNPENDNLDALGNYLCQMVNQLCTQAELRCRLHVQNLPREVQLSSQIRHNLSMAIKEAVHNVLKHARASEVTLLVEFSDQVLTISIQDDGCGFRPETNPAGNGLTNLQRRLQEIGGTCVIESQPGRGTQVRLRLEVKNVPK